jgi:8-oxo-dGTP diphosphatase
MHPDRRHLHVACAIIERDGLVLAAQRSPTMSLPLSWEFPGGKLHEGERPEEALARELVEELGVTVAVGAPLSPATHRYPGFTVTLFPFRCAITGGVLTLHEHAAIRWLPPAELHALAWAPADAPIIAEFQEIVRAERATHAPDPARG